MPLIQIDLAAELYERSHAEISAEIQQAQVDALGITPDDLFHVFRPHAAGELKFDPTYNGVDRQNLVLIHITMVHMYSVKTKRALFEAIVSRLGALGIRSEDILIAVAENGFEDWYAGK
ncbi:tautomerase family protein [Planctomonas psychrotolerans]|uniref:tautomerase family protein n=1 Tax=Planctomonas psychrotolerans TaxID=2528712 RepID=UPI00123B68BA|nr:tautomerase family protein [Planctomonas psychrotolerans]